MLFSIKNRLLPSLFLFIFFVSGAFLTRYMLDLTWQFKIYQGFFWNLVLGLGVIVASDIILHFMLWFLLGDRYLSGYCTLVEYFRPQGVLNIAASGLLAGGEELAFRGVLLEGLMSEMGVEVSLAVLISALVFSFLHMIRDRRLAPFALWAFWEGVLLGAMYVATRSLLVSVIVHTVHDIGGFSLFALQRRTGWLLRGGDF